MDGTSPLTPDLTWPVTHILLVTPYIPSSTLSKPFCLQEFGTDNYLITYASDRRFGLVNRLEGAGEEYTIARNREAIVTGHVASFCGPSFVPTYVNQSRFKLSGGLHFSYWCTVTARVLIKTKLCWCAAAAVHSTCLLLFNILLHPVLCNGFVYCLPVCHMALCSFWFLRLN